MANKKINELDVRATLSLSDLMIVGDPSSGYAYKTTLSDLQTLIATEADTLDSVTDRGNTTTNSITVGAATISGSLSALNGLFNIGDYDTGSGGSNKSSYAELKSYNNDGYGDGLSIQYSRGTVTTPAAVQTNDLLGGIYFKGYNGTNNQLLNYIEAIVTGYGTHPKTKLVFTTTNGNDTYSYISMILDPDGRLFLGYNVQDKGPSYRLQVDGGVWATGALVSSLAGTGTRMVVADSTGVLSTQSIPSGGGGGTPAGSNAEIQFNNSGAFGASPNFVWDNTNARLGIGTTPSQKIDVLGINLVATKIKSGTNSGASAYQAFNDLNNSFEFGMWGSTRSSYGAILEGNGYIYGSIDLAVTSLQNIKFGTGSSVPTERMRLTQAGRLLLGTTSESTYLLDVNGTARVSGVLTFTDASTGGTGSLFIGVGNVSPFGGLRNVQIGNFGGVIFTGSRNVAIGSSTISTGNSNSITIGNANTNNGGFAIGYVCTSSNNGIAIGVTATSNFVGSCVIGTQYGASSTASDQFVVESPNWYLGSVLISNATTNAVSINGQSGNGTNINANIFSINGGRGTGSGTSGDVIISTATTTTSGTTLQSLTERLRIKGTQGSVRFIPIATPSSAEAGDVYYDSSTNKLRCYNGTTWNDLF